MREQAVLLFFFLLAYVISPYWLLPLPGSWASPSGIPCAAPKFCGVKIMRDWPPTGRILAILIRSVISTCCLERQS